MYKEDCHSILCSTIILSVAIWSVQLRPARNPACSSLNFLSNAALTRSKITLQNTLLAMFSSMIPRQFLQWLRSPFVGSLINRPFFYSSGTFSSFHIRLQKPKRTSSHTSLPPLIASGGILSQPAAFPFLSFFIAFLTSARVMEPILMFRSLPGSTSGGLGGSAWFKTPSKSSFHPWISSSAVLSSTPASVLTGLQVLWIQSQAESESESESVSDTGGKIELLMNEHREFSVFVLSKQIKTFCFNIIRNCIDETMRLNGKKVVDSQVSL